MAGRAIQQHELELGAATAGKAQWLEARRDRGHQARIGEERAAKVGVTPSPPKLTCAPPVARARREGRRRELSAGSVGVALLPDQA